MNSLTPQVPSILVILMKQVSNKHAKNSIHAYVKIQLKSATAKYAVEAIKTDGLCAQSIVNFDALARPFKKYNIGII